MCVYIYIDTVGTSNGVKRGRAVKHVCARSFEVHSWKITFPVAGISADTVAVRDDEGRSLDFRVD